MDDLVLYTNPMSRGRIARWMLEEIGEPYDTQILDYSGSMKESAYLLINPMAKVPALRHGDHLITETGAICTYLAEAFAAAGLAPTVEERADYYRWMFFAAGPLEGAVLNRMLGIELSERQQMTAGFGTFELAVDVLDGWIGQRDFVCGSRFTAADVYLGSQVLFGVKFGMLPERPAFADYIARLSAREAYQRATAIDDRLAAEIPGPSVPAALA